MRRDCRKDRSSGDRRSRWNRWERRDCARNRKSEDRRRSWIRWRKRNTLTLLRVLDIDIAHLVGGALGHRSPLAISAAVLERVCMCAALHARAAELIAQGGGGVRNGDRKKSCEQWEGSGETHCSVRRCGISGEGVDRECGGGGGGKRWRDKEAKSRSRARLYTVGRVGPFACRGECGCAGRVRDV